MFLRENKGYISYLDLPHGLLHLGEGGDAVAAPDAVVAVHPHVGLVAHLALAKEKQTFEA